MAPAVDPYSPIASPPPYNLGSEEVRSPEETPPPEVQEAPEPAPLPEGVGRQVDVTV
ncbi:MAG: hypothetical protein ACLFST_10780 [Spirochaetia bacterium]